VAESFGNEVAMPRLLTGNRKQFTDLEGNESRLVTKVRWVIEAVNGRLKNVFNFFDNTIQNHYVENNKLLRFLRISCAMLNAYFPVLRRDRPGDFALGTFMVERSEMANLLAQRIEAEGWNTRRTVWSPLREAQIQNFPMLSIEDLQDITVGIYQIKMAPSYISRSLAQSMSGS
jgi:hypothetical protein